MNVAEVQTLLNSAISVAIESGWLAAPLNQSELVLSFANTLQSAEADALQKASDVAAANAIASGLIHPATGGPVLI
jgi:hypothetical protein